MEDYIHNKCMACEHFKGLTRDEDDLMNVLCTFWGETSFRVMINNEPVVCPKDDESNVLRRILDNKNQA